MMTAELAKATSFGTEFRELIGGEQNAELRSLREKAFAFFEANGFPTPRNEDWKYTNVAPVVSGKWEVDSGLTFASDGPTDLLGKFTFDRNGFTALNLAFADVKVVRIAKDTSVAEPIEFTMVKTARRVFRISS